MLHVVCILATQSVVHSPAKSASPVSLLEEQNLRLPARSAESHSAFQQDPWVS